MKLWMALAIFCVFLALYLVTPTSNYTFDAVNYANMIRLSETSGPLPLFHPHHILYNSIGLAAWRLFGLIDPGIDPLGALQIVNSFAGAFGLAVFFLVLRRLLADTQPADSKVWTSSAIAAAAAAAVGLTFGWWVASTDGRPYIPPMAAVLAAFYFSFQTARTASAWSAAGLGAAAAAAALLHQSHALFLVVGAAAIAISPTPFVNKLKLSAVAIGVFLPIVLLPYIMALRIREAQSISEAIDWAFTYAKLGVWWDFDILGNIDSDLSGMRHAFLADISGKSAKLPFISALLGHAAILFSTVLIALGFLDRTLGHIGRRRRRSARRIYILDGIKGGSFYQMPNPLYVFNVLMVIWIISYSAFFTVWTPGFFVFWIPVAAAWVVFLIVNGSAGTGRKYALAVASFAAVCFGIANLWLYVLPKMPKESNRPLMIAQKVKQNTPEKSLVIVAGMGYVANMEVYIPYFAERETVSLHHAMIRHGDKGIKWLREKINKNLSEGSCVYVFGEVFDSPKAWQELGERYGLNRQDVRAELIPFRPVKRFKVSDQPVYELRGER